MTQAVGGVSGPQPTELALFVFQLRIILSCNLEKCIASPTWLCSLPFCILPGVRCVVVAFSISDLGFCVVLSQLLLFLIRVFVLCSCLNNGLMKNENNEGGHMVSQKWVRSFCI